MHPKRTTGKNERGFTLPELMIVIVLIGILAAIAVPSFRGVTEGGNVDSAANQLAADMRLAHSSATNRLGEAGIEFRNAGAPVNCGGASASASASYCLVRPTASGGTESLQRNLPANVKLTSPNLLAPASGVVSVRFAADSSASTTGTLGSVTGVSDSCPVASPPTDTVPKLQVTVDSNPASCLTFNNQTSEIRID